MAQFQKTVNDFLFLGLFIFAFLGYIIVIQADNNALQPISDDPLVGLSYSDLNTSLSSFETTSQVQYGAFTDETPKPGFGSIVLFSIVGAGKTFGNITLGLFLIIVKLPLIILGVDTTITSILITWLILSLLIGLWVFYKLGG